MAKTGQNAEPVHYAQALAAQLIRYLGYQAAERTCLENHWSGVLQAVRNQRPAQIDDANP